MSDMFDAMSWAFRLQKKAQERQAEELRAKLKDIEAKRKIEAKVFVMDRLRSDLNTGQRMTVFKFLYNLNNPQDV